MVKQDDGNDQLNLTVVALVALVAIVGLVALVMNAASMKSVATGSKLVTADENIAGQVRMAYADDCGNDGKCPCSGGKTCVQGCCVAM